jgi:signal transduction histidine kinase
MNILLVEDNPADARLIGETLKESHAVTFRLTHRERLADALAGIGSSSFDAVLLDLNLPDSLGLDTVARMIAAAPNLPVIVLTGFEDEFTGVKAVEMGAQDYLVKGRVSEFIVTRAIVYACQRKKFAEMSQANALLMQEVREREQAEAAGRLNEVRLRALLKLHDMKAATADQVADVVVAEQLRITQSECGFLGFLDAGGSILHLHTWSIMSGGKCAIADTPRKFPVEKAGSWGEAVRRKKPLIVNDFSAPHGHKKGCPAGHVELKRLMVLPVIDGTEVVAVSAVANKEREYDETDMLQLKLLLDTMWEIIKRSQAEAALKESEQQLQFLAGQLLASQETERKRVAQELHDSVGQTMSALKFAVECSLNQRGRIGEETYLKSLQNLIPKIQNGIEELDRIGRGLRPSVLDDLGIMATFSWFCREFQSVYSTIRIEQDLSLAEDEVPDHLKLVIYRILQESLNNIAKHSHADRVRILFEKKDGAITLSIKDNGRGFDAGAAFLPKRHRSGFGLFSMKKRAELSGGNLVITSAQGRGTVVSASWPAQ